MKNRDRWIMISVLLLATTAVAVDHMRHRPPYTSQTSLDSISEEAESPCSMGLGHAGEEDEEDEL